jgi:hypothetical protein
MVALLSSFGVPVGVVLKTILRAETHRERTSALRLSGEACGRLSENLRAAA